MKIACNLLFGLGVALAAAAVSTGALADTLIDTTTAPTTNGYHPFGYPTTQTYGEGFTVGSDSFLNTFSLYLIDDAVANGFSAGSSLNFYGYIGTWDGSEVTSILYTSSLQTMTANGTNADLQFQFAPDIQLTAGDQYMAFLSSSALAAQSGSPTFGMPIGNALPGGDFSYFNNTSFGQLSTPWDCQECGSSAAGNVWFQADLSPSPEPAPEPASLAILGAGLAGLGAVRRRRKA